MEKLPYRLQHLNSEKILAIQDNLIQWYEKNQRDLPWRRTNNPYYIWISEIMLQQTRVDTVIGYYNAFIEKFPRIEDLANADEDHVLKAWEGLGYYNRAKRLQQGARVIVEKYGGEMPKDYKKILDLPGIGPYTVGAITSIAFHQPIAAVDGNVMRVFSRVFHIKEDIMLDKTRKNMEKIGNLVISHKNPSYFNQGLMELGALICTPTSPKCVACPLYNLCEARRLNVQESLPLKTKKPKQKEIIMEMALVCRSEDMLITKRPKEGLLGGLWALPSTKKDSGLIDGESIRLELLENYGIRVSNMEYVLEKIHIFTHIKWKMKLYRFDLLKGKEIDYPEIQWVNKKQLENFALPTAFKKLIKT
ncbi:MAG: A/G-specific adenine glycosylase [Clostridiaceae bacterium]|nr:A/G-specific adenine glycosylase [Clostridiaceae bacterium]